MTAEEFWKDDPQLFESYRISFFNKKKKEVEETDYKSWLTGLYVHEGNSNLLSKLLKFINNSFGKNKDNSPIKEYPSKPHYLTKDNKKERKVGDSHNTYN